MKRERETGVWILAWEGVGRRAYGVYRSFRGKEDTLGLCLCRRTALFPKPYAFWSRLFPSVFCWMLCQCIAKVGRCGHYVS